MNISDYNISNLKKTGKTMPRSRQDGFTLVELMITVAVLAVLLSMALPSFRGYFDKKRLVSAAEAIYSELQLARSEAVARSSDVYVNFSRTSNTVWALGTSVNTGCDPTVTSPTTANACVVIIDDGDGTVDDGTGTVDSGDLVLRRKSSADFSGGNLTAVSFSGGTETRFEFVRGTATAGSVSLQSDAGLLLDVVVSPLGRIKICVPSGDMTGYPSCS